MMTERLRRVVEQIEQLPEEEQDAFAASLQSELDEARRWKIALNDPHRLLLDDLLDQAEAEIAKGEIYDMDEKS